jgi:energy-coupling factor transport system substrate-specific component
MTAGQPAGRQVTLKDLGLGGGVNARMIAVTGVMLAVTFVMTRSVTISIGPGGFVHMGDIAIFVTAFLFGPVVALIAGGLGTALADVSLGYGAWAPGTLVIHGLQGFAAGLIAWRGDVRRMVIAAVVGGVILVVGYFLYMLIFIPAGLLDGEEGKTAFAVALAAVWPNTFQVGFGAIIGAPLALAVRSAYPPIQRWGGDPGWVEEPV